MAWLHRGMLAGLIGFGALIVVNRISGSESGLSPKNGALKEAVFAARIPVYPGAKLKDVAGGSYYEDIGGPVTFRSKSWFFEIKQPVATVAEFYRGQLPEGSKPAEAEEGSVAFEWIPPGSAEGELVSVTIREGELQITETVKAR